MKLRMADGKFLTTTELLVNNCPKCRELVIHGFGHQLEWFRRATGKEPISPTATEWLVGAYVKCRDCGHGWILEATGVDDSPVAPTPPPP